MRLQWFSVPALALLVVTPLAGQQESPSLPALPEMAPQAFEPAVRDALREAHETARSNPLDGDSVGRLGMLLHAYRQYETAALYYARAQRLQPDSFRWAYYQGLVQAELGQQEKAVANLRLAGQLRPNHAPLKLALARTLLSAGKVQESRQLYESLARSDPNVPQVHYGLGQVMSASEEFAAAIDHYREACRLAPEFGAAHYALALALRRTGQSAEAEKHLGLYLKHREQTAVLKDPFLQELHRLQSGARDHLERGLKLQADGRIREAIGEYRQALEADPERPQTHLNLLSAYLILGQPREAEKHYREAIRISPHLAEAHYNYGLLLIRQGRETEAADAFRKVLDINPHYAEAHNNLGYILFQSGQVNDAENHFRQAVWSKPDYGLAHYNLARLLLQADKPEEAIAHLRRSVSSEDEQTPLYLYTLADACARAGRLQEAVHYAEKAKEQATSLGQTELAERITRELEQIERSGHLR